MRLRYSRGALLWVARAKRCISLSCFIVQNSDTFERGISLYCEFPSWEWRTRSQLGLLLPYQMVDIYLFRTPAGIGRYIPVRDVGSDVQSTRGCTVELSPALMYTLSSLLIDDSSGLALVVLTSFVAKKALSLLWEAYDT